MSGKRDKKIRRLARQLTADKPQVSMAIRTTPTKRDTNASMLVLGDCTKRAERRLRKLIKQGRVVLKQGK